MSNEEDQSINHQNHTNEEKHKQVCFETWVDWDNSSLHCSIEDIGNPHEPDVQAYWQEKHTNGIDPRPELSMCCDFECHQTNDRRETELEEKYHVTLITA